MSLELEILKDGILLFIGAIFAETIRLFNKFRVKRKQKAESFILIAYFLKYINESIERSLKIEKSNSDDYNAWSKDKDKWAEELEKLANDNKYWLRELYGPLITLSWSIKTIDWSSEEYSPDELEADLSYLLLIILKKIKKSIKLPHSKEINIVKYCISRILLNIPSGGMVGTFRRNGELDPEVEKKFKEWESDKLEFSIPENRKNNFRILGKVTLEKQKGYGLYSTPSWI